MRLVKAICKNQNRCDGCIFMDKYGYCYFGGERIPEEWPEVLVEVRLGVNKKGEEIWGYVRDIDSQGQTGCRYIGNCLGINCPNCVFKEGRLIHWTNLTLKGGMFE